MPTPTTTDKTIRVSGMQVNSLYNIAASHMVRPGSHVIDVLVPWGIANIYLEAAVQQFGRHLQCEPVRGPRGEQLAYITGEL
jgi:hypothetical protein